MNYVVSQGIGSSGPWMVFERRPSGSLRRICSKALPIRASREEVQEDLRKWLEQKGPRRRNENPELGTGGNNSILGGR